MNSRCTRVKRHRHLEWICLLVIAWVHAANGQDVSDQDVECLLFEDEVEPLFDADSRTWTILDDTLEDYDLQAIVNCTVEGDTISLQTTRTVQPQSRIVIPWELTIGGSDATSDTTDARQASLTCPSNEGLFLVRGARVSFINVTIEGCDLADADAVAAIIETEACSEQSRNPNVIQFSRVGFTSNRNLGGSVGVVVRDPACYSIEMQNVRFQSNLYASSAQLSQLNRLENVSLNRNNLASGTNGRFFSFPPESTTTVVGLSATDNAGTLLRVDGGVLDISDAFISRNSARRRGAVAASASTVSISTSQFDSNSCEENGAAVFLFAGSNGTFSSLFFVNNSAASGAALHIASASDVELRSSVFQRNRATDGNGGAVYITARDSESEKTLRVVDCFFQGNYAEDGGGGMSISHWEEGRIIIRRTTFTGNSVRHQGQERSEYASGGAIQLIRSHEIELTIADSLFDSNIGNDGGALQFSRVEGELEFESTNFTFNQARGQYSQGGGFHFWATDDDVEVTFRDTLFDRNFAGRSGGAISASGNPFRIRVLGSQFFRNRAHHGGGVHLGTMQSFTFEGCWFQNNTAVDNGGAIRVHEGVVSASLEQSIFLNNTARAGGAVFTDDSLEIVNCTFRRNAAQELGGAGLMSSPNSNVRIHGSAFVSNTAVVGGALYGAPLHRFQVEGQCSFQRNQASLYGGAIYYRAGRRHETLTLRNATFVRNRARFGGAAFFQIDRDDVETEDDDDWNVQINNTVFEENHAEHAGGAVFVERVEVLRSNCHLRAIASFSAETGHFDTNFECESMRGNSVGQDGYGENAATPVASFYATLFFENGTRLYVEAGESLAIPNWRSGDSAPVMQVSLIDYFHQGPAVTKSTAELGGIRGTGRLARYDDYARATLASPDNLIPNPLIRDVSNGTANITVGGPLQEPGDYSLLLWIGNDEATLIAFNITLRECIINEEFTHNRTLCTACDTNQFNFHPQDRECRACPDNVDCTSEFTLPPAGYWNAFPCSDHVRKCINDEACIGSDATQVLEMVGHSPVDCNFTDAFKQWYQSSLCEEGYTAALCGSCASSHGRVGIFHCRECLGNGLGVVLILTSIFIVMNLAVLQIKGNLDSAENWTRRQISLALRHKSRRVIKRLMRHVDRQAVPANLAPSSSASIQGPLSARDTYRQLETETKWKFVEHLKITINFLQTVAAGVSLDVAWNDLILYLLQTLDWLGGAAIETSRFTVDCLLSNNSAVARSIVQQILLICVPLVVLFLICIYWGLRAYLKKVDLGYIVRRFTLTAVVVFYVAYISLTKQAIDVFYCVDVYDATNLENVDDTHAYWAVDTAVRCYHGGHWSLLAYVALPLLIFALLFPLVLAVVLIWARRRKRLNSVWVVETVGLFFRGFETRYIFWDSIILLRKALLAAIVVFSYSLGGNLQGLLAVSVLMLSLFLQTTLHPFKSSLGNLNQLESLSLLVNSMTFLIGVILNDPNMDSTFVEALLVAWVLLCNVGLTLLLVYLVVRVKIKQIRFGLMAEGIDCESENGLFVIQMYILLNFEKATEMVKSTFKTPLDDDHSADEAASTHSEVEMANTA